MRAFLILCALFACSACAAKRDPDHDPKAAVEAVIDHLGRAPLYHKSAAEWCVDLNVRGPTLDHIRHYIVSERPTGGWREMYDTTHAEDPAWGWYDPGTDQPVRDTVLTKRLNRSVQALLDRSPQESGEWRLAPSQVKPPLKPVDERDYGPQGDWWLPCELFRIERPSFHGNIAFVDVWVVGGGCWLTALEWKGGQWKVVGVLLTG